MRLPLDFLGLTLFEDLSRPMKSFGRKINLGHVMNQQKEEQGPNIGNSKNSVVTQLIYRVVCESLSYFGHIDKHI